jgi:hypothetical protein
MILWQIRLSWTSSFFRRLLEVKASSCPPPPLRTHTHTFTPILPLALQDFQDAASMLKVCVGSCSIILMTSSGKLFATVASLAPGRELCAVELPLPAPYHRLHTLPSKNSLSIQSTSRLEDPLSTKRPCGYSESVRHSYTENMKTYSLSWTG